MKFNSFQFLLFFSVFFLLYWLLFNRRKTTQNIFLLLTSYIFYCFTDWKFAGFLLAVSLLNYFLAIGIARKDKYQKLYFWIGMFQGIGGLLYFKYFNFFIDSFNMLFRQIGINAEWETFNIIFPLGISYFTFRLISYIIDVNKERIEPSRNIVSFLNYVAFFPSILSGPIDKARDLIPQIEEKRNFNYQLAMDGTRQILWGLFKKVVVANSLALYTQISMTNYEINTGSTLFFGALFYVIQLYADFSGYSDMAIGVGKLMGFRITKNFQYPLFAQNIAAFWRKWHISLTSWLAEYVFTPLSFHFRNQGKLGLIIAIVINFVLVGVWHGANWTFIVFGFIHGFLFIPMVLQGTLNKRTKFKKGQLIPKWNELLKMMGIFLISVITFTLIRAESVTQAYEYTYYMFNNTLFTLPYFQGVAAVQSLFILSIVVFMMAVEWVGKDYEYPIAPMGNHKSKVFKYAFHYLIALAVALFWGSNHGFIYFQF